MDFASVLWLRPELDVRHSDGSGLIVRIGDDARRCVVFFGKADPMSGEIVYGGTGFLVGYDADGARLPYLVTCRHVAKHLKSDFVIRINTTSVNLTHDRSHVLKVTAAQWEFPEDETVDLAATTLNLNNAAYDVVYMVLNELRAKHEVQCGDPISIVGLFRLHAGSKRNMPIVHTGNVALLPDPREKIPLKDRATGKTIEVEGYLVEAQTLEGLSGSPVFVRNFIRLSFGELPDGSRPLVFAEVSLLGIYSGAWDGEPGEILAADRSSRGNFRVPVGVGVVVPVEKLEHLLRDNPALKKQRETFAAEMRAKRAAIQDDAFPVASPDSTGQRD